MNAYEFERLLQQLATSKSDKKRITLYLSSKTYEEFKKACELFNVSNSEAIEQLMQNFVNGARELQERKKAA